MKIASIKKIIYEKPVPVYDVIDTGINHNFIIKTNTSKIISHNCAFLDEISFARIRNVKAAQERAMELFDAAHERMQSRFTKFGGLYEGLLIMASSKRTDQAFLEVFVNKLISESDKQRVLIIDRPRWEVLPKGTYSGPTFPFAVGDKFLPSQIIKPEQVEEYKNLGYKIIYPPIETYGNFEKNMMKALTDIAGISVMNQMSFLRGDKVRACINKERQNPFVQSIIYVGNNDNLQYSDFFDMSRVDPKDIKKPMCIHLDASLGGDGNAISGTIVSYAQYQRNSEEKLEPELHFKQIFKIKVKAPHGDKVMLSKNFQFIVWLKKQGFNIQLVEHDQFQSFQFGQDLAKKGFNVKLQSIDRVTDGINIPYQNLQSVIYEKRIDLLDDDDQTNELVSLEQHEDGRIDKPGDESASDDAAQALCGSVYGCGTFKAEFLRSNSVLLENVSGSAEDNTLTKDLPEDAVASLIANQFSDYLSPNKLSEASGLRQDFDKYVSKGDNNQVKPKKSGFNFF